MAGGWFLRRERASWEPKPFENLPRLLIGAWAVLAAGLSAYFAVAAF